MQLLEQRKQVAIHAIGKTNKPTQSRGGAAIRRRWWAGRFKRRRRQAGYSLEQLLKSGFVRDPKTGCLLWRQGKRRVYGTSR